MNEEEKKAIENMESFINYFNRIRNSDEKGRKKLTVDKIDIKALKEILKLIEKLQKENEELRKFILEGVKIEPNSPYQNHQLDFLRENFIPIKEIKEKFKKINETKIDLNKINARDYMIFGNTEMATGWFINIDYIEKILLDVPGYKIESKLKK